MKYVSRADKARTAQDYYYRHKHIYLARAKRQNRRARKVVAAAIQQKKDGEPCADCGQVFPTCCMDFDHLPGSIKKANVADTARFYTVRGVMAEMRKCELVCSNCHRIRTFARRMNPPTPVPPKPSEPERGLLPFSGG